MGFEGRLRVASERFFYGEEHHNFKNLETEARAALKRQHASIIYANTLMFGSVLQDEKPTFFLEFWDRRSTILRDLYSSLPKEPEAEGGISLYKWRYIRREDQRRGDFYVIGPGGIIVPEISIHPTRFKKFKEDGVEKALVKVGETFQWTPINSPLK